MADQPSGSAEAQPDPVTIPNLRAILKESLVEILRETPSLLQPPADAQQGKCSARDVAGLSCVDSVARRLELTSWARCRAPFLGGMVSQQASYLGPGGGRYARASLPSHRRLVERVQ